MEYGLIGEHLGHSYSPEIHSRLGNYGYELAELSSGALGDFLKSHSFKGLNVTIPYKKAVIPYMDRLSEEAAATGAVNTIVIENGSLVGYNTDCYGFECMLRDAGISLRGRNVLILGAGGASLAVRHVAASQGAERTAHAVRHISAGHADKSGQDSSDSLCSGEQILYADLEDEWDVIVNATPAGMYPSEDECPLDLNRFQRVEAVFDCIYNPLRTNLVLDAESLGMTARGGLMMLVGQAMRASKLFAGVGLRQYEQARKESVTTEPDNDLLAIKRITDELARDKSNIVLIGMPSCGKTSVGRGLAARLGREFLDCDEIAVRKTGMSISEYFSRYGESAFRQMESEVIREVSMNRGTVIATGGGAVLNPSNVRNLKRNGTILYLDTDLSNLTTGHGRPLSRDRDALAGMFALRAPLYSSAADVTMDNNCSTETALVRIMSFLGRH